MSEPTKITTPDGPDIRLIWPSGTSSYFREERFDGFQSVGKNVQVTPVLLDTGEVRFYAEHALSAEHALGQVATRPSVCRDGSRA